MGGGPAPLCGFGETQPHRGSGGGGRLNPGVLVAGPTAFSEKRRGQCQGTGDAEPDARMEAALEEPPSPSGRREEGEATETELNIRLPSKAERWPRLAPVTDHGLGDAYRGIGMFGGVGV